MVSAAEVRDVVDEHPDLEPVLRTVLEASSPWTFDDIDVDSGRFGELVSQEFVESVDDGYRLTDPDVVRTAIDDGGDRSRPDKGLPISMPDVEVGRLELGALAGALALVVLLRLTSYPAVFQGDAVVLSSNDPYYYRYWLELLLEDPETTIESLPGTVEKGEPLFLASVWFATRVLGGTTAAAGTVLAWYPVVSAVITALLVYAIAVLVTEDRRIGIGSVLMLAVLPGHAFRTSVGFADHHAFDYPWLGLTVLGIVLVIHWSRAGRTNHASVAAGVAAIAVGVAGQTLAWEAGALLIVPLGIAVAAMSISSVYRNESVLERVGPVVLGTVVGAGIAWLLHSRYGWHTELVALAPVLLAAGSSFVLLTAIVWNRTGLPAIGLAGADVLGGVAGLLAIRSLRPDLWTRATSQITDRLLARREIAEVNSLFSDSAGWLLLFGFLLLLAVPYVAWAATRAIEDDRWTPLVVYTSYFLLLAAIQVRFAGQLSLFVAMFASVAFVHLAAWIDVARLPAPLARSTIDSLTVPSRRQLFTIAGLFLLVAGLSIIQVPIKTSQVTAPNDGYDAAAWMADYSDEHEMEYPENYVLSQWGHNRMYNYFVNGEARSYGFARSSYVPFVTGTNPERWHERLGDRVGFVVTSQAVVTNESAIGTRLHENAGSRNGSTPGMAHYRLVHVEDAGELKVFTVVDGAVVRGTASPNETVTLRTTVQVEGAEFEYRRQATANENGTFSVRVAYPGTYEIGDTSVTVPEAAVRNGSVVTMSGNATVSRSSVVG